MEGLRRAEEEEDGGRGQGARVVVAERQFLGEETLFTLKDFLEVQEQLRREPEILSPGIRRAEVIISTSLQAEREGNTIWRRKLVPRQQRHPLVWQQQEVATIKDLEGESMFKTITTISHKAYKDDSFTVFAERHELPYFYPAVLDFSFVLTTTQSVTDATEVLSSLKIEVEPFHDELGLDTSKRMMDIWNKVLSRVIKLSKGTHEGYQKQVHHDVHISKNLFQDTYLILKEKYAKEWVEKWPEVTDPKKHVFEDILIATFLILLWRKKDESSHTKGGSKRKYKFVDVGCGNGFLTYLLLNEGFAGYGVDLAPRKLWSLFPSEIQANLNLRTLDPLNEDFSECEWILGNHSDELTPWIPLWAARSQCVFVIIPCCPFLLTGERFTICKEGLGRYGTYCSFMEKACKDIGFTMEREVLRIPSTRNICLFTLDILDPHGEEEEAILNERLDALTSGLVVKIRKSDRQKTLEYQARKEAKKLRDVAGNFEDYQEGEMDELLSLSNLYLEEKEECDCDGNEH